MNAPREVVAKNANETYCVSPGEYKGHRFIDLRVWYRKDGELRPTPKGIAIKPDALDAILQALRDAGEEMAQQAAQ